MSDLRKSLLDNEVGDLVGSERGGSRTSAARDAYKKGDVKASIAAHANAQHEENHGEEGSEYVKSLVFGGLDGIVTTFAIVATGAGANQTVGTVLLFGFAGLIADGISMGLGDYFSTIAQTDFALLEKSREEWEYDNYREGEIKEMVDLYHNKYSMTVEDATAIVSVYSKYKDAFVDLMMVEELNLEPPDPDDKNKAWKNGLVTLLSFWFFGSISLVAYLILLFANVNDTDTMFVVAAIAVGIALFSLGVIKAKFTQQNRLRSGVEMIVNGSVASVAAYGVAMIIDNLVDESCPAGCIEA
jgi:DNA damage-binding protein 1